jgi:hypothetical protein
VSAMTITVCTVVSLVACEKKGMNRREPLPHNRRGRGSISATATGAVVCKLIEIAAVTREGFAFKAVLLINSSPFRG